MGTSSKVNTELGRHIQVGREKGACIHITEAESRVALTSDAQRWLQLDTAIAG